VLWGRHRRGHDGGPLSAFRLRPVVHDVQGRGGRGGSHWEGHRCGRPSASGLPLFAPGGRGGAPLGLGLELDPQDLTGGGARLWKELAQLGEGPALGVEVPVQRPDLSSEVFE